MSGGGLLGKGPSTLGSVAKLTLGPVKNITKKAAAVTAAAPPMPKNALNLLKSKMEKGLSVSSGYGNLGYSRRSSPPKEAPPISPRVTAEPGAPSVSASPPPNDPSRASPPQVKRGITFRNNKPINNNRNTRGKVKLAQLNSNNLQLARQNPNYTRNTVQKARSESAILRETFGEDKWINAQVAINSNPKISANFKKYMNVREAELASLKKNYSPLPIPINIYKTYAIPDKLYRNINAAAAAAASNN